MITVEHLSKHYGKKVALDDVSFAIKKGEIVGLLGLNGAGKSTTMNVLTGYISPTMGRAAIDGHDIIEEPKEAKRQIGYLPESLAFYSDMRVDEYLKFICDLKGVKEKRDEHIAAICKKVGIEKMAGRMIRNLSKGYRQRVGLAQSLVGNPKVLILDEPTVGLDPSQIIEIRSLIQQLGKNSTVIISSHILSEIQAICTRVIVLYNGKLVADAPPDELGDVMQVSNRVTVRVAGEAAEISAALKKLGSFVKVRQLESKEPGTWDFEISSGQQKDIRADISRVLARADLPLLYAHGSEMSLEDVFLSLVQEQEMPEVQKEPEKKSRGVPRK